MQLTKKQLEDLKKIVNENIMLDHDDKPFFLENGIHKLVDYIRSIPTVYVHSSDKIMDWNSTQEVKTSSGKI